MLCLCATDADGNAARRNGIDANDNEGVVDVESLSDFAPGLLPVESTRVVG